ncbi:Sialoadhesin [Labeo rohita]|uniref:Sialoadhesin n=1 Tax=Labeo rohita TaxID=84645 RepID=A0ABQ8L5U1_LABRO|nr:Sialoadhesin [Labeo rohita]
MSCTVKYTHNYKLTTIFWTKPAVTDGEPPDLCSDPENKEEFSVFTTNTRKWTVIPGAQLDVTDLQVETQQSVKEGDSVTLTCKSSCSLSEQTTFIWYRNTQRLTKGTSESASAVVSQSL